MDPPVHFRHQPDNDRFELVFNYVNAAANIDRAFHFQRLISETIDATFARIRTNIEKELKKGGGGKKKKPQKNPADGNNCQAIQIVLTTQPATESIKTWIDFVAFVSESTANQAVLKVGEQNFNVTYNHPYVRQVAMPAMILVGFECYPAKFEVVFAEREQCKYQWYRGRAAADGKDDSIEWVECDNGDGFFYTVKSTDFQHKLKVILEMGCPSRVAIFFFCRKRVSTKSSNTRQVFC